MGANKSKVGRCVFLGKFSVAVLTMLLVLLPHDVSAKTTDMQLQQYVIDLCLNPPTNIPANWDTTTLADMCMRLGGQVTGASSVSTNLGIANAGSGASTRKRKGIRERLDEKYEKRESGASADAGGWGVLFAPQYGNSNRVESDLENGYQSDLKGLVVGLDYRFSDSLVLGATIGNTRDRATFLNSAGLMKTSNNTIVFYGTWISSEETAVDGYLGYGKINLDIQREIAWATPSGGYFGTVTANTTGQQALAGMSASFQKDIGRLNLSPFLNLDYIKTRLKGYNESGTTTLEMHYGDRSTTSLTSSIGVRISTSYSYDWGLLQPSARLAAVHEFQNNTKQISNELVSAPGSGGFIVSTDSPDRNYLNTGLGLSAALNSGTQLFIDYDRRTQDRLLSSWAISLGALMEF